MVGQQLPTEIGWQGEHRGRGLTLNAFVTTLSASRASRADGPPHTPRDAEVLAFEAGCQDYCRGEIKEIKWRGGQVYLCRAPRHDDPPPR
jgi:hypothetical protein